MSDQEQVTQAQLQEMRKLVLFSKRLSEWHIKNLKLWPQIVFDNLKNAEVEYNIGDRPDESYIRYTISFKENANLSDFNLRKSHLERWVKSILWSDVQFSVIDPDGKEIKEKVNE